MFNIFTKSLAGKMAPEITGEAWFNVTSFAEEPKLAAVQHLPLSFAKELSGTVTLIHFWDYSDNDSLQNVEYLKVWWEKYEGPGFVIIGVHTPQYAFAEDSDKVESAVLRLHLDYPVVSDSSYTIWKRYENSIWPRTLLVDAYGVVRADVRGKNKIATLEDNIRRLLTAIRSHV